MTRRILHVVRSLQRETGGIGEAVRQLAAAQTGRGDAVAIVSLDSRDANADFDSAAESLVAMQVFADRPSSRGYAFTPEFVPWLRRNARDYDAVIVHGLWQYQAFGTWRALHGGPTPYLVFPHGMLDVWFKRRHPLKHAKKWLYWPWADYRVIRDAATVCYTAEMERRQARMSFWLYRANEVIVPIGIKDPAVALPAPDLLFSEYPTLKQRPFLLFLGRIHPKKGIDLLLRAYARVYRDTPARPLLVIAGPTDNPAYLTQLQSVTTGAGCHDDVVWLPLLSGTRKWAAIQACDAFVLCSHQENFAIAIAEALACSRPVLISDQIAIHGEISRAGAGLVENDSTDGAEQLLRRWRVMTQTERSRMGISARALFVEKFEVQHAATALDQVIGTLASTRS